MDDEYVRSLLQRFVSLPTDIILRILSLLEDTYHIAEFFLYWKETRQLVKDIYYKEIHCLVSPLPQQSHVCLNGKSSSTIFDLHYFGEIDDFLDMNPDLVPSKILFSTGNDFMSLFDLFKKHETRLRAIDELHLIMNGSKLKVPELKFILGFQNLTRLQLGRFDIKGTKSIMKEILPTLKKLNKIEFLGHNVLDWREFEWPPNLKSLDCSWNSLTDVSTLKFNPTLRELYLNMANIDSDGVIKLSDRLPDNLSVLMLSYNRIETLHGCHLKESIEKLDVSFNKVSQFSSIEGTDTFFPVNLQELNLSSNYLTNATMARMSASTWPQNLRVLNLSGNRITDLYSISLPDSIQVLQLDANDIRFLVDPANPKHIKQYRFPKYLRSLSFYNSQRLLRDLEHTERENQQSLENSVEFAASLKQLSIIDCNIRSLKYFQFPKSLKYLNLTENLIDDINSYKHNWLDLVNLEVLEIDTDVSDWTDHPPNLK